MRSDAPKVSPSFGASCVTQIIHYSAPMENTVPHVVEFRQLFVNALINCERETSV